MSDEDHAHTHTHININVYIHTNDTKESKKVSHSLMLHVERENEEERGDGVVPMETEQSAHLYGFLLLSAAAASHSLIATNTRVENNTDPLIAHSHLPTF